VKKLIVGGLLVIFFVIVLLISAAVYGFSHVLPTTGAINQDLAGYFSNVVYIPKNIPPPSQDFYQTIYFWEMVTPEKEVVGIRLKYDTGFTADSSIIRLTLEKEEKGDPSIFDKVLPAVIADKQSLDSARDPQKANLSANQQAGYKSIKLLVLPETNKTAQIVWEFDKFNLPDDLKSKYKRLEKFPPGVLKFLYTLPHFILSLFSA